MECSVRSPATSLSSPSPSACASAAHMAEAAASLRMSPEYRPLLTIHSRKFCRVLVAGVEACAVATFQLSVLPVLRAGRVELAQCARTDSIEACDCRMIRMPSNQLRVAYVEHDQ